MIRRGVFTALCFLLLAPAVAQAGQPFTIGEGTGPHLTVNADNGTAHVVWVNPSPARSVTYCRVPRGATGCARTRTLTLPVGVSEDDAFIVREGSVLTVVMPTDPGTYSWRSTNDGETWTAARKIYGAVGVNTFSEPVVAPANQLSFLGSIAGRAAFSADTSGDQAAPGPESGATGKTSPAGEGYVYNPGLAQVPGGTFVAVADSVDSGRTAVWRSNGLDPSTTFWTDPNLIPGQLEEPRVAAGPGGTNGTYLYGIAGAAGDRVEVRKWEGTVFGAPLLSIPEPAYLGDVTVGPGTGAVAAIWRKNEPSGGNRLRMALSTNGGATWSDATIAREDVVMADMDVALAGDNVGFAVYEGGGGGATAAIRLADTVAISDPLPPPPTTTTPPPAGPVTTTPPPTPGPTATRPTLARTTASVNGARLELAVPAGCIPPGRPFTATLSWRKLRRKGNLFVKVSRTDFFIGTRRLKIDRRAPFRQTLRIPNPRSGQTYTLRARAFIKVRRGNGPKKSLRTRLRVCS